MSAVPEFAWTPPDPKTELETLFENAPLPVAQGHRSGSITALNPSLEQLLGGKLKPGRKLYLADLLQTEDCGQGERLLRELFNGERESFQLDSASIAGSPKLRWTAWRVSGTSGQSDYAVAIAHDYSELAQGEQRLRQAQKLEAVGRLAGGVAHDFNNLLTGVLLYCDLLMASLSPPSLGPFGLNQASLNPSGCDAAPDNRDSNTRLRKYVEEIRKAGLQATNVVRQLLAVARPTSGEACFTSLNEVAEGMRNLLVRLIAENIELTFELDPKLGHVNSQVNLGQVDLDQVNLGQVNLVQVNPGQLSPVPAEVGLVKMDPTEVQQILLNLVLNARDAMPGGGRIAVQTASCKFQLLTANHPRAGDATTLPCAYLPCALLLVSDNGSGMDEATRAHLFEAFFTTKAAGKGTGLGLATVYDIVTRNGGLIHVDSAPACGTRVTVLLPLVPQAALNSQFECSAHSEPIEGELPATPKE